ncbi:SxtJ family membrane protein [Halobacteriovorax marinus]|uniref:SxtJ family membrane protein n=1 Tax=Halobacteriovorax marinus TaxID=97084 RepID=UPI003A915F16
MKKRKLIEFALLWSLLLLVYAITPLLKDGNIHYWALCTSLGLIVISIFSPQLLAKPYKFWMALGEVIGGIMSKIILSLLYFGVFTPMSLLFKLTGKDLLKTKIIKSCPSYWIKRTTQPQSMKNQF